MNMFTGTGVAVVTPFTKENKVDFTALAKIINHLIDNGIDYLVALGSTAEAATLSMTEKQAIAQHFIATNKGRVPLVIGIGGNNTAKVVEDIKQTDFHGFDAVLSVSPSYNKPSQEGIYQHYKAITEACPLPIILYNVPGRTGKNMEPETTIRLANDFDSIIGIKEASGNMEQVLRILRDKPQDFLVISGDDMIALPMVLAGGVGVISVIAQALPQDFSEMIHYGLQRKVDKAFEIQNKVMPAIDLIFEEGNPTGIKAMLSAQSLCENILRLPLVEATQTLDKKIGDFVKDYN